MKMDRTAGQGPEKLETIDEGSGASTGISRRHLLMGGAAAGLGGLVAANMLSSLPASASAATGYQSVPVRGQSRQVIWANGAIADWNLSYDVGSIDAARFLGWSYKKVGLPQTTYSSAQVIQVLNEVIALKPDVMITPDWVEGEGDLFAKAQKAGIFVIVNNATNFPDQMSALGIAGATSDPNVLGQKSGTVLVNYLAASGKKSGTIIMGNPYPQNTNQQGEVIGVKAAIAAGNAAHGTKFVGVELADNSGTDEVGAIGLWKAKITQLGSSFVGGFAVADSSTQAAVKAYQQSRFHAGQYPLAAVDVTTASLSELQQGWVLCVVDAGFYMQGWLPVMLAFQQLNRGYPAAGLIDCSGAAVTKSGAASLIKANNLQIKLGQDYGVALA
jgi:ABC-type sugar transport system substrate-binding protein